ncbi:MAG: lamin tail domain-containing protein [Candidatus Fermentibacteraceae bacterium]|nr:lamin tail domain-containing protein [Candidatus Fermentibacteraceae bacterium]
MLLFSIVFSLVLAAPCDIVISEIMYNPDGPTLGDDDSFEWVEFCNIGAGPVEMYGMMLSDGGNQLFLDPFTLEPGGMVVVAADMQSFKGAYGEDIELVSWDGVWTKLSNSGDQLTLYSEYGEVLDELSYSDEWGVAEDDTSRSAADGTGSSLEKVILSGPNDRSNWMPSIDLQCPLLDPDDGCPVSWGTPGQRNSVTSQ